MRFLTLITALSLLGASGCGGGSDGQPVAPTPTPTPAPVPMPTPEPEPEPEPPSVPTGLRVLDNGQDFIEWIWIPVVGTSGYDVQYSTNEVFTDEDEIIPRTAEQITYRRDDLDSETGGSVRVRSASGSGGNRITSVWSTHVTGMTEVVLVAPPTPTGLRVSATETSITWTWNASPGAQGYVVQVSEDEVWEDTFEGADQYAVTRSTSYTIAGLEADTTRYARVAAGVPTGAVASLDPGDYLLSAWTIHATGTTDSPPPPPPPSNVRGTFTSSAFGCKLYSDSHDFVDDAVNDVSRLGYWADKVLDQQCGFAEEGDSFVWNGDQRESNQFVVRRTGENLVFVLVEARLDSGLPLRRTRGDWWVVITSTSLNAVLGDFPVMRESVEELLEKLRN